MFQIVHFRQHEVIVYPDDNSKPSVGEELNRFAEISLDRVWPRNRKTKEYITVCLTLFFDIIVCNEKEILELIIFLDSFLIQSFANLAVIRNHKVYF